MHCVVVVLMSVVQASGPQLAFVSLFTECEYRYTGGDYHDALFKYRLFVPEAGDEPLPLIVWLHGRGEASADNIHHLRWLDQLIFRKPWDKKRYPFYLLAVQCPTDNPAWTRGADSAPGDDMVNVVKAIVDRTLAEHPIDRDRVYLAGLSSGGAACWDLALRHPGVFAAVTPMAGVGGDPRRIDRLKNVPVWAFHSNADGGTPIEPVRASIAALKAVGGTACLTEIDSSEHDCWCVAFEEYHVLDWLLSQRRGAPSPLPGTVPLATQVADFAKAWQWWQVIIQLAIPGLVFLAIWHVIRHRRRVTSRVTNQPAADPTAVPSLGNTTPS